MSFLLIWILGTGFNLLVTAIPTVIVQGKLYSNYLKIYINILYVWIFMCVRIRECVIMWVCLCEYACVDINVCAYT